MKNLPIKRAPTFFLRAVIVVIAIAVIGLCILVFSPIWNIGAWEIPEFRRVLIPGFIGLYASALPFFFALYQALKLLNYIDKNNAFSQLSARALGNIKFSAIAMTVCYMACMPVIFTFAQLDDAPGVVLIGFALTCAPLVVATFAAVLQKLVQNAVDMKTENDLTI